MASFPTSVKTFTNRAAGQTIASAHMNDVQDEINAIEAGYLQGSAPLNSSNSTVAALSVSGGSTFAVRPVFPLADAVRLGVASTGYNVAHNSTTAVSWTGQTVITNSSMHSTATNPDRVTPQSTGLYLVHFSAGLGNNLSSNSTMAWRALVLDSSGVMVAQARGYYDGQLAGTFSPVNATGLKQFDVVSTATWLRVEVVHTSGSTNSLDNAAFFEVVKL